MYDISTILEWLYFDLRKICKAYMYQPCTSDNMYCFKEQCQETIEFANKRLIHYRIKAIFDCDLVETDIVGRINFIDLRTGNVIKNIEEYS